MMNSEQYREHIERTFNAFCKIVLYHAALGAYKKIRKKQQLEVNKELIENLKKANIEAQVDPMTGDIKISDLELFELSSYTLSDKGKAYLDKLVPIYINTISPLFPWTSA